ncbi:hypothetical protein QYE76_021886 [Lolium multiflorum]|uniref:Uncharacterized protein n=1 Tax=Lolium multiflorum TaxID=4521 RepID=A0AAD8VRB5_LOLMU|nr:hypothetical protein QYE76_021886 [Lolium multiflorum]
MEELTDDDGGREVAALLQLDAAPAPPPPRRSGLCCWWRGWVERGGMRPSRRKAAAATAALAMEGGGAGRGERGSGIRASGCRCWCGECLRSLLGQFESATGLAINYSKSTLVPMHVQPDVLRQIQDKLRCRVEGFPQTYLGLPLSAEKLPLAAFTPLIAKVDKYLSSWHALLLSAGGRLVLLNAVLDVLPTFAMGALQLPPGVLAALDLLRRAFLWAATDKVSGARRLVAWEQVCRPKEEGGLGVRSIATQNACLLVKLLHRLHCATAESWPRWVWDSQAGVPLDMAGTAATLCDAH